LPPGHRVVDGGGHGVSIPRAPSRRQGVANAFYPKIGSRLLLGIIQKQLNRDGSGSLNSEFGFVGSEPQSQGYPRATASEPLTLAGGHLWGTRVQAASLLACCPWYTASGVWLSKLRCRRCWL